MWQAVTTESVQISGDIGHVGVSQARKRETPEWQD
jgi:hypothetical protein